MSEIHIGEIDGVSGVRWFAVDGKVVGTVQQVLGSIATWDGITGPKGPTGNPGPPVCVAVSRGDGSRLQLNASENSDTLDAALTAGWKLATELERLKCSINSTQETFDDLIASSVRRSKIRGKL